MLGNKLSHWEISGPTHFSARKMAQKQCNTSAYTRILLVSFPPYSKERLCPRP